MENNTSGILILTAIIGVIILIIYIATSRGGNLNNIKSKKVGDGLYGTAEWATRNELKQNMQFVPFEPKKWRQGKNLPNKEGIMLASERHGKNVTAIIDTSDNHTMVIAASGGGKTTSLLYPNLEYSAACGMSFLVTDTKGTVHENYVPVMNKYGVKSYVIDLRNPAKSNSYNLLYLVNKYIDKYNVSGNLSDKAKSESYAKIIGNSIIHMDGFKNAGQNQFFYEAAEGVISGITLLVSELCPQEQRHIISVFKCIRQLMEFDPATVGQKEVMPQTYFSQLYAMLPENSVAKDLLASAATSEMKTLASVVSTAISRMLSFIDSEMEQLLCFNDGIDIEHFVQGKTAIFFVFDESSNTKNFIANLLLRQTYNELLKASEYYNQNHLPHRIQYFLDEFGTYTAINGVDQFFSAGRSRNIIFNPFLQTCAQLDNKYNHDTAKTIRANCQNIMFGFQSPLSDDADYFSKVLNNQTVMTGSVSLKNGTAQSTNQTTYTMVRKPLMPPDEIRRMKKGDWVLMRTGMHPIKLHIPKCDDLGIEIDYEHPYKIKSKTNRKIEYADRTTLMNAIKEKYSNTNYSMSYKQPISGEYLH